MVQSRKGKDGTDVPKLESSRYVRPGLVRGRPGRLLGLLEECGEGEPSSPPPTGSPVDISSDVSLYSFSDSDL